MITGSPMRSMTSIASSRVWAVAEGGTGSPMSIMAWRNLARSSAVEIALWLAPITSTPYLSTTPDSISSMARFSAVCPPRVGSSTSGCSRWMMLVSTSRLRGST